MYKHFSQLLLFFFFVFIGLIVLLILASQRIETVLNSWFGRFTGGFEWISDDVTTKRGAPPTMIEWLILSWVFGDQIRFLSSVLFLFVFFSLLLLLFHPLKNHNMRAYMFLGYLFYSYYPFSWVLHEMILWISCDTIIQRIFQSNDNILCII